MVVASKRNILDDVCMLVGSTIKISADKLDPDAEFPDLGIDSIIAMELMENLSRHFGIAFTPAQFLNVNTVRELAGYLENNFSLEGVATPAPAPAAVPAAAAAHDPAISAMLDNVKQKYGIDLSARQWTSVDEIVEELLAHNLEQVMPQLDLGGVFEAHAGISAHPREVAIIGISCRFPDAPDAHTFWENLLAGKSALREIPRERWDWQSVYAEQVTPGKTISKWGALITDIDRFDPQFFNIRPEEARLIDPQERLLMQEVYKAVQDAGLNIRKLAGTDTGVFVGYEYCEYEQYLRKNIERIPGLVCSSSSPSYYLANRLSFVFDFRGPSEAVNVNCASSAVAINRAWMSLINGESELAVAASSCLHLFAGDYITSSQYGLLSPNGSCAVFDNDANGFVRGEGVAALVLKRLDDAVHDHDRIYGVIKACHQSNRGGGNTLSDVKHEAITEVIQRCYEKAGLSAHQVSYLELNGYAKKWADSFEFEGVKNAFAEVTPGVKSCALGSLKGNIGHMEPVNGIASVIKVALSLHHKKFPPSITRRTPSTFIDLDSERHPLYFAEREIEFGAIRKDAATPVRAAVSSFADSGVNVHILLEEYMGLAAPAAPIAGEQVFVLSAKDDARLLDYARAFLHYLSGSGAGTPFVEQIHTLQVGREALNQRLAILASDNQELCAKLQLFLNASPEGRNKLQSKGVFHGDILQAEKNGFLNLITGDMTVKQMEISMQSRQWQQIALLWVHGVAIPWEMLWAGKAVRRTSLPAYPFARERHWVDLDGAQVPGVTASSAALPAPVTAGDPHPPQKVRRQFASAARNPGLRGVEMDATAKLILFLRQEIAEMQRREAEMIDLEDNFIALGLSSIGIAELITKAGQLLQISLAPTVVFKYPSIQLLAQYLAQSQPQAVADLLVLAEEGAQAPATATAISVAKAAEILIPLQPAGEAPPLFMLPGADGSSLSLKLLAEAIGVEMPLYAFDAPGLDGISPLPASVEELAVQNIAAMRQVQAHGPYRLLGYSNGGVLAFAMADVLLAQGEQVESLILLDSLIPAARQASPMQLIVEVFNHLLCNLGGQAVFKLEQLEALGEQERADYLYAQISAQGLQFDKSYFLASYKVATHSEMICRAYQFGKKLPLNNVYLFKAIMGYQNTESDYGWNAYLQEPVQVREVAANHFTVIEKNAAGEVAEMIRQALHDKVPVELNSGKNIGMHGSAKKNKHGSKSRH